MDDVTDSNKKLARTVAAAFGGKPRITRYWDENERSFVDILVSQNRPQEGVTSYATLGLSDHPLLLNGKEYETRVELVGACGANAAAFGNIMSTAAFCVINSHWFCRPGAIFPDVVAMYQASRTLRHLMFVPPFLWEAQLPTTGFPDKKVAWLLAVPISEREYRLAEAEGADRLEDALVDAQIDMFDLDRPSVV